MLEIVTTNSSEACSSNLLLMHLAVIYFFACYASHHDCLVALFGTSWQHCHVSFQEKPATDGLNVANGSICIIITLVFVWGAFSFPVGGKTVTTSLYSTSLRWNFSSSKSSHTFALQHFFSLSRVWQRCFLSLLRAKSLVALKIRSTAFIFCKWTKLVRGVAVLLWKLQNAFVVLTAHVFAPTFHTKVTLYCLFCLELSILFSIKIGGNSYRIISQFIKKTVSSTLGPFAA